MNAQKLNISNKKNVLFRIILSLLLLSWCIGFAYPVVFRGSQSTAFLYPILNNIFGNVCHQNPAKVINFNSSHFLVCSRCAGIYFGALAVSFLIVFVKRKFDLKNIHLFLAVIPMLTDIFLYSIGIYTYSKTTAFITGWLLGSVGFLYIFGSFENFLLKNRN